LKLIFADTGGFYALADRHDPAHARARLFMEGCEAILLTTDFVFAETMSLLTKRLGKEIAITFGQALRTSPSIRIEEAGWEVREKAWKLFSLHRDKDYDLIDCITFSMMESFRIREAFGFDRHFTQHGCRLLPS
jgi:predicted nucleic acid-binding protein